MIHIDDGAMAAYYGHYQRTCGACSWSAPIEDGRAMRRMLWFALVLRFGKPAIIVVGSKFAKLAIYLV